MIQKLTRPDSAPKGSTRELLRLAWPLMLSHSFLTLQILIDRILLSRTGGAEVGASMQTAMVYWAIMSLLLNTANYATTFVAQYTGAGQPRRVGPVVWQSLHFSLASGLVFLLLVPLAGPLFALIDHESHLRELETVYFQCLCFAALPTLVTASTTSFFAGRGDSRTVLLINAVGLAVNGLCAYAWIYGEWGFPVLGIVGAGWATVAGAATSALLSLWLMLRPRYRLLHATWAGRGLDRELLARLLRFGVPNGVFAALDALGFTLFLVFIGKLGEVELAATTIAFSINMIAFLPILGIGQAVEVLVGQRLGEDEPDLAERSTWIGMKVAQLTTGTLALVFVLQPGPISALFRDDKPGASWDRVGPLVPVLLRFVAVYCLFDAMNLVFSFALRGAGDTRFVTRVALVFSWPLLVLPTWATWSFGWGLYWAWAFASLYIMSLAVTFLIRFRRGKWRSMRVIETS